MNQHIVKEVAHTYQQLPTDIFSEFGPISVLDSPRSKSLFNKKLKPTESPNPPMTSAFKTRLENKRTTGNRSMSAKSKISCQTTKDFSQKLSPNEVCDKNLRKVDTFP